MKKERVFKITSGEKVIKSVNYNGEEMVVEL